MKRTAVCLALALATALPLRAQNWSLGVGTGPFVFGDFYERSMRPTTGEGTGDPITFTLSAATRAGVAVDVERAFADRWGLRLEGTFTSAPLSIVQSGEGAEIEAGDLDATTLALPLIFRINPSGALRFHLAGGPAHVQYKFVGRENADGERSSESSGEWGVSFGGGAAWWISDRFAIEGAINDIITTSPFDKEDFPAAPGIDIPKPHNVHTTIGVRWRI